MFVQMTKEHNGRKYHYCMTIDGWIDYNAISCE